MTQYYPKLLNGCSLVGVTLLMRPSSPTAKRWALLGRWLCDVGKPGGDPRCGLSEGVAGATCGPPRGVQKEKPCQRNGEVARDRLRHWEPSLDMYWFSRESKITSSRFTPSREWPAYSWEHLQMDYMQVHYWKKMFLVVVDGHSKGLR